MAMSDIERYTAENGGNMRHFEIKPIDVKNSTLLGIKVVIDDQEVWLPKSRIIMTLDIYGNLHILVPIWICESKDI